MLFNNWKFNSVRLHCKEVNLSEICHLWRNSYCYAAHAMHWPSFPLFYSTWTWPDDVIRPRSLRPSTLWDGVLCHSWTGVGRRREFGVGHLYREYSPVEWFWVDSNVKN